MTGSAVPRCPRCGEELVLELDPAARTVVVVLLVLLGLAVAVGAGVR